MDGVTLDWVALWSWTRVTWEDDRLEKQYSSAVIYLMESCVQKRERVRMNPTPHEKKGKRRYHEIGSDIVVLHESQVVSPLWVSSFFWLFVSTSSKCTSLTSVSSLISQRPVRLSMRVQSIPFYTFTDRFVFWFLNELSPSLVGSFGTLNPFS